MHRACVSDEVEAGPGVSRKEFGRQEVALEAITARARQHDVSRDVSAAVGERVHVVERRNFEVERRGAVHAAAAAITHRGSLDRSLLMSGWNVLAPSGQAREAGK
jgi:hypothetical protein